MFKNLNIQEYLSLGYIFLIIVGILNDAIFYGMLGVPYMSYTTILDALISPISLLTDRWEQTIVFLGLLIAVYFYVMKFVPWVYKKSKNEKLIKKSEDKKYLYILLVICFLIIFPSVRLGMGLTARKDLKAGEMKPNYTLVFKDNKEIDVRKIGQNSSYFFYVEEGDKVVTATPILENIKQIKRIPKDD